MFHYVCKGCSGETYTKVNVYNYNSYVFAHSKLYCICQDIWLWWSVLDQVKCCNAKSNTLLYVHTCKRLCTNNSCSNGIILTYIPDLLLFIPGGCSSTTSGCWSSITCCWGPAACCWDSNSGCWGPAVCCWDSNSDCCCLAASCCSPVW